MSTAYGIGQNVPVNRANYTQISAPAQEKIEEKKNIKENQIAEYTPDHKDNTVLTSELTVENFKESMEKEFGCSFNEIKDYDAIEERFMQLLKKLSDDEKTEKLMLILTEFNTKPALIKIFFNSFENPEKAQECADKIDLKTRNSLTKDANSVIIKHMSAPGSKKLLKDCGEIAEKIYNKHKEIIENLFKSGLTEEQRQEEINKLPETVKNDILEYCKLAEISLTIVQDAVTNSEKYTSEDSEEIITIANNIYHEQPIYNIFLEKIAKIFSNDSNNLNIDKSKLTELLDKLSDNKFSEEMQKQAEKTSYDQENGGYKTGTEAEFDAAAKKAEELKEAIVSNTPSENDLPKLEPRDIELKGDSNASLLTPKLYGDKFSFDAIKDLITGKVKVQTKSEETAVIEGYKLLNTAIQGNLLQRSTGEFFNKLIDNTKTSTLRDLIAVGWKGRSFAITKQVEETIEERKDDVT